MRAAALEPASARHGIGTGQITEILSLIATATFAALVRRAAGQSTQRREASRFVMSRVAKWEVATESALLKSGMAVTFECFMTVAADEFDEVPGDL